MCICLLLLSNYKAYCGLRDRVWLTKIGQLRKEANSKQISYMVLIGVHSTMHLMQLLFFANSYTKCQMADLLLYVSDWKAI